MKHRVSAVVTMEEIRNYFKGDKWKSSEFTDSSMEAHSNNYDVSLQAKDFKFRVRVEAEDDPTDSDETTTEDPVKFLEEFLGAGAGSSGGFEKMSSSPKSVARALRALASRIDRGNVEKRSAIGSLRRIVLSTGISMVEYAIRKAILAASQEEVHKSELDDLLKGLKSKGWKAKESSTKNGFPSISVDMSGIYTAEITVDTMVWSYVFEIRDYPDSRKEGMTNDPIQQFRLYYKDPSTQEYESLREEEAKTGKAEPNDETVAPPKKSPSQDDETVAPPKKRPNQDDETVAPPRKKPSAAE